MDIQSVLVGLVAGGAIGAAIVIAHGKKVTRALEGELERLRKQSGEQLKQAQAAHLEATKDLAVQRQRLQALEKSLGQNTTELDRMRDSATAAERARDQALEQANARQAARVQAEGRLKQAEKLASESVQRLEATDERLKHLLEERDAIATAEAKRNDEIRRLRAELSAAHDAAGGAGLESSVEVFADTDGSLQRVLQTLLDHEGLRAAVLADANGIVIAAAGETVLREGIAATAQMMSTIGGRFEGMVPFGIVRAFAIRDAEAVAIAGRTFHAAGETLALATYGNRAPNERVLDGAMASLNAALE
ncbi:MAG: hypothetical protein IPL40_00455 [Proteobacteria bacterium]|nr:hypothetical protein [Pseudomonadota bacterium]